MAVRDSGQWGKVPEGRAHIITDMFFLWKNKPKQTKMYCVGLYNQVIKYI